MRPAGGARPFPWPASVDQGIASPRRSGIAGQVREAAFQIVLFSEAAWLDQGSDCGFADWLRPA